jgi:hypothetical protein
MNPSDLIDQRARELTDWRGDLYVELRNLINKSSPGIKENWKWNTAVWTEDGLVCALGAFKNHVKVNFFKGARLTDPHELINNGFNSKQHRAIDFFADSKIDEKALQDLIREAVSLNKSSS